MAYRYQRAYEACFKKLSPIDQGRVKEEKDTVETKRFIKDVVALAEGDVEL